MLPPPTHPQGLDQTPAVFTEQRRGVTHTGAAHEDHTEGLHDASDAHHPSEPQEEDDAKDVLQAREVHAHEGAHAWGLPERPASVSTPPTQYQQPSPHLLHVPSLPLLACLPPPFIPLPSYILFSFLPASRFLSLPPSCVLQNTSCLLSSTSILPLPSLLPRGPTCTGFFFPPSLFSASSCSLLPWGRLV